VTDQPLLSIKHLDVAFDVEGGTSRVLSDLCFELARGETLGIVGESGCGKSMTALAIMGLIPTPPGRITRGEIRLAGENIVGAPERRLRQIRGNEISMVFQEPMSSLNPVFTVGEQIAETIRQHQTCTRKEARDKAIEMLRVVGIPAPERRVNDYPHHMSGGMRQRVMIAIALACQPKILIADEPTTALDVTVQAQIFDLFIELKEKLGTAIILITHDIGVVAQMTDRVMVMYAGRKIEEGRTSEILKAPHHPYTRGLISCVPHLVQDMPDEPEELFEIPGVVPNLTELMKPGCPFAPRCGQAREICKERYPDFVAPSDQHGAACWLLNEAAQ